jgi:hypothetical protein
MVGLVFQRKSAFGNAIGISANDGTEIAQVGVVAL